MSSETVGLSDLFEFSERGPRLPEEDVKSVWLYLVTRTIATTRWRMLLRVVDEDGRRMRRMTHLSPEKIHSLVVARSSLLTYGASLRLLRDTPQFFMETRDLTPDKRSLLMDWLRHLESS